MAEGQDTSGSAPQEPSMEEILASIRKIISDDEKPADTAAPSAESASDIEEVVELTQMVQDDGSVIDIHAAPVEEATPFVLPKPEPAPEPVVMEAPMPTSDKSLASDNTVSSSASALSALANTIEIERLSTAPQIGTGLGNGSRTLEDMVIELMRPLLKDWLDKNLPATVDRLVQKEIERISRKVQ